MDHNAKKTKIFLSVNLLNNFKAKMEIYNKTNAANANKYN